jgi:hypothetical protein
MSTRKHSFLVAYDYGAGGLWGIMQARSADEIVERYPELDVVTQPPVWMDEQELRRLHETTYDIDGAPRGLLEAVLADRQKRSS